VRVLSPEDWSASCHAGRSPPVHGRDFADSLELEEWLTDRSPESIEYDERSSPLAYYIDINRHALRSTVS
jgi:hypothetical protein